MDLQTAITGGTLVELWNHGRSLRPAFWRLVEGMPVSERAQLRDEFLARAREQSRAGSDYDAANRFVDRMSDLLLPAFIDVGTLDGLLAAALVVNRNRVPSQSSVIRALSKTA
jgi:hypothetical protein